MLAYLIEHINTGICNRHYTNYPPIRRCLFLAIATILLRKIAVRYILHEHREPAASAAAGSSPLDEQNETRSVGSPLRVGRFLWHAYSSEQIANFPPLLGNVRNSRPVFAVTFRRVLHFCTQIFIVTVHINHGTFIMVQENNGNNEAITTGSQQYQNGHITGQRAVGSSHDNLQLTGRL
ncbi:hypothetical protein Y032_0140g2191 [Ancylostoma ceylanicum]|uniref:Uncharacterized protein n=1 Tax=Ancylostoma ceylanicum TaxID=53326 RepID=A0A016T3F1_9BILA|nr:hypothetical protein Y032_0140g2191 [Ancylostoma ceylanicum]